MLNRIEISRNALMCVTLQVQREDHEDGVESTPSVPMADRMDFFVELVSLVLDGRSGIDDIQAAHERSELLSYAIMGAEVEACVRTPPLDPVPGIHMIVSF